MYALVEKTKENNSRLLNNSISQKKSSVKQGFGFFDDRPKTITQRKLQLLESNSARTKQLRTFQEIYCYQSENAQLQAKSDNYNLQQPSDYKNERVLGYYTTSPRYKSAITQLNVIQRLVGAAAPIAGHDEILPGNAANRGDAAGKIAKCINLRARETHAAVHAAPGVSAVSAVYANSSVLGANNAGNLYVRSNYTNANGAASSLETWSELTPIGGGYVKRIRIIEGEITIMDRVMNDSSPTALQLALANDAAISAGPIANRQFNPVHSVVGDDKDALDFTGGSDRDADNITKIVGEGARFGWLSDRLSNKKIGNTTNGIFNVSITIPQEGTFTMNPTFQQLWGAWDSAFRRSYMKNKQAAIAILKQRLKQGLRTKRDNDLQGPVPLKSGNAAGGQITSLLRIGGGIALMPKARDEINGARIITDLGMTWTSDR